MSEPRTFAITLLVASSLSLALSIACQRDSYPKVWHIAPHDNSTYTDAEVTELYWTEEYRHAEILAREEAARQAWLKQQRDAEALARGLTQQEQQTTWILRWKKERVIP